MQHAMQLPIGAIVPGEDGGTYVVLIAGDGTTKKQAVKVGIRTADSVQIISGVSAGDMVVTQGGYGLDNGTKVTIGRPGAAAADKD